MRYLNDGFLGQKILKLWRQESWPFGPWLSCQYNENTLVDLPSSVTKTTILPSAKCLFLHNCKFYNLITELFSFFLVSVSLVRGKSERIQRNFKTEKSSLCWKSDNFFCAFLGQSLGFFWLPTCRGRDAQWTRFKNSIRKLVRKMKINTAKWIWDRFYTP